VSIDNNPARLSIAVSVRDHSEGYDAAVVTLVEYGDYECPYCGKAYPIVKELQRRLGSKLRFVFRHFPLSQIHPHAKHAAEAAEAAGAQEKFWEMHDALFQHQAALDDRHLREYAASIGIEQERFSRELATHAHAAHVREDFLGGVESGVNGTPTFFINGIRHDGSWDIDTLEEELRGQVARAQSSRVA
jgi:protein-disulfide isomerase